MTGASGFIGAAVLHALSLEAPQRTVLLAGRNTHRAMVPRGCRAVFLDLAASDLLVPEGVDTVLNLAGEVHDPSRMQEVNHLGPVRLVEAAARVGAQHFVHLSSVGVYGAPKHAGTVDETCVRKPKNVYEASKNAGELAVRERCAALGLRCTTLQPSTVIGIVAGSRYPLLGLARMVARGWFCYFGRGDAWINYVSVEDVAAALVAATDKDACSGSFIVNTPVLLRAMVGWIAEETGVLHPDKHLPVWVGAAAAAVAYAGRTVLRRDLPFSPERFFELTNTTQFDGSAISGALNFAYPIGIEGAVRTMVRHYRQEGLV